MAMSDIIPTLGVEEAKDWKKLLKALAAEFIGTMFLVILACGACINLSKLRNAMVHFYFKKTSTPPISSLPLPTPDFIARLTTLCNYLSKNVKNIR